MKNFKFNFEELGENSRERRKKTGPSVFKTWEYSHYLDILHIHLKLFKNCHAESRYNVFILQEKFRTTVENLDKI